MWDFDKGATSKFYDVLLDHGGLPHVLPLAVHLYIFSSDRSSGSGSVRASVRPSVCPSLL